MTDDNTPQIEAESDTQAVQPSSTTVVNKRWGCAQSFAILVVAIIAIGSICAASIFFMGQSGISSIVGSVASIFQSQPSSAEIVTGRTLINSIQPLGQLVTISTELAQADILVEVDSGTLNLCGHSANHVAEGVIEAGVDFTLITPQNISYTEASDTYKITVPYPRITSCRIEYIRQYDTQSNLGCSPNWDNVRVLAQAVAMDKFVEDALGKGVLERAERENTLLMQSFVGALTSANVEIVYVSQETAPDYLPSSCQPSLPNGWRYDNQLNKWVQQS